MSDSEMEDVLTMDKEAMQAVTCAVGLLFPRRLPPMFWVRIRDALDPEYLLRLQCEGVTVHNWRHDAFAQVARQRYHKEEADRKAVHSLIADYWLGGGRGCDAGYNTGVRGSGDEPYVLVQPLTFKEECEADHYAPIYNRRKLDQLPKHLYLAGRLDELDHMILYRLTNHHYKALYE